MSRVKLFSDSNLSLSCSLFSLAFWRMCCVVYATINNYCGMILRGQQSSLQITEFSILYYVFNASLLPISNYDTKISSSLHNASPNSNLTPLYRAHQRHGLSYVVRTSISWQPASGLSYQTFWAWESGKG